MGPSACPACQSVFLIPYRPEEIIRREIDLRARFVQHRLDHKPERAELTDLTEFAHGGPGRLLECLRCGLIVREERSCASYADDVYDSALFDYLYPRYRDAFLAKEPHYRHLLPAHADVLELGSHTGAFLETAETWGWRPVGLDIGKATSSFCRRRGLNVRRETLEDSRLPAHGADALFIWNCFEQLADPETSLRAAHRALKRHGLLVIRTPNFSYYRRARGLRQLAYNNLLGFPYLTGYRPGVLLGFLLRQGFDPVAVNGSNLIANPFPAMPRWAEQESSAVLNQPRVQFGPWIEAVARRR